MRLRVEGQGHMTFHIRKIANLAILQSCSTWISKTDRDLHFLFCMNIGHILKMCTSYFISVHDLYFLFFIFYDISALFSLLVLWSWLSCILDMSGSWKMIFGYSNTHGSDYWIQYFFWPWPTFQGHYILRKKLAFLMMQN